MYIFMEKKGEIINSILFYGIIVSGIIYVLLSKNYIFISSVLIPSIAVSLVSKIILRYMKLDSCYMVYINLGLWLNLLGEYYFYYNSIYYDKVLHFFIPLFITILFYKYFEINSKGLPKKSLVFLIVLGLTAVWEIFEYFQSGIFNFPSVGVYNHTDLVMPPYKDTIWDLFSGCFGALGYLIFKKEKIEKDLKKKLK
jgi:hypothetical protein